MEKPENIVNHLGFCQLYVYSMHIYIWYEKLNHIELTDDWDVHQIIAGWEILTITIILNSVCLNFVQIIEVPKTPILQNKIPHTKSQNRKCFSFMSSFMHTGSLNRSSDLQGQCGKMTDERRLQTSAGFGATT